MLDSPTVELIGRVKPSVPFRWPKRNGNPGIARRQDLRVVRATMPSPNARLAISVGSAAACLSSLIACANVANRFLPAGHRGEQEIAVRA